MGERGPNAAGFWCALLILVPIGLFILSALIRFAVWAANKCRAHFAPVHSEREEEPDDAPRTGRYGQYRTIIPAPGLGGGAVIALIALVLHFVFGCLTGAIVTFTIREAVPGGVDDALLMWVSRAFAFVAGAVVWWGVFIIALPTSFGRAALVTLFLYTQLFLLGLAATPMILVAAVFGGR